MNTTSACQHEIGTEAIGGEAIGSEGAAATGRSKVWASSLGGQLLRVRELSGPARRRAESDFVRAAAPWLRKLLKGALAGRVLAENKGEELERDEVSAAAWRGLGEAMAEWDPEKCPSFTYFARWRVLREVAKTSRSALVVAGARPRCFDEIGELDGGGVDVVDGAQTPEEALIEREDAAEEAGRTKALRRALAALPERVREVLLGGKASRRERESATGALRAELRRLGVEVPA